MIIWGGEFASEDYLILEGRFDIGYFFLLDRSSGFLDCVVFYSFYSFYSFFHSFIGPFRKSASWQNLSFLNLKLYFSKIFLKVKTLVVEFDISFYLVTCAISNSYCMQDIFLSDISSFFFKFPGVFT